MINFWHCCGLFRSVPSKWLIQLADPFGRCHRDNAADGQCSKSSYQIVIVIKSQLANTTAMAVTTICRGFGAPRLLTTATGKTENF